MLPCFIELVNYLKRVFKHLSILVIKGVRNLMTTLKTFSPLLKITSAFLNGVISELQKYLVCEGEKETFFLFHDLHFFYRVFHCYITPSFSRFRFGGTGLSGAGIIRIHGFSFIKKKNIYLNLII